MSRTRYAQAAGSVFRDPVVESTPALEIELLTRFVLKDGTAKLRELFDRNWTWPDPAPLWAMLACYQLQSAGLLGREYDGDTEKLSITEAGWVRVGRRRIPGVGP